MRSNFRFRESLPRHMKYNSFGEERDSTGNVDLIGIETQDGFLVAITFADDVVGSYERYFGISWGEHSDLLEGGQQLTVVRYKGVPIDVAVEMIDTPLLGYEGLDYLLRNTNQAVDIEMIWE